MILYRLALGGEFKQEIGEWLKDNIGEEFYGFGDHDITDLSGGYISLNGGKPVKVLKLLCPAVWFSNDRDADAFKRHWNDNIRCTLDAERLSRFPLENFDDNDCPVVDFNFPAKH